MSQSATSTTIVECSDCGHRFLAANARTTHKYRSDGMWITGNPGPSEETGPWCPRLYCQAPITDEDREEFSRVS